MKLLYNTSLIKQIYQTRKCPSITIFLIDFPLQISHY